MDMVFRNEGATILWYNGTGSDVEHGDVIDLGDRIGVAEVDIDSTESGSVRIAGVFQADAIATDDFEEGDALYWDPSAENLTNIPALSASVVETAENTGDGTVGDVTLGDAAIEEVWTLTGIAEAESAGTFSVIGSKSGRTPDLTVAVAYDNGYFSLTVADGTNDWDIGDIITITISQANYPAGFAVAKKASAGTTAEVKIG